MEPSLTDRLCTRCGLCCDGTLFADVEIAPGAETRRLELLGLEVDEEPGQSLLSQPCAALKGRRCSIYEHRPRCCRTFECRLLRDTRQGTVALGYALGRVSDALARVQRVKRLLRRLGERTPGLPLGERCAGALAAKTHANSGVNRRRNELGAEMAALETLIRRTFLRGARG